MKFFHILLLCFVFNGFSQGKEKMPITIDKLVKSFQKKHRIPGISVSISHNNSILYSKGYGYSNLENKIPINPSKTKFRIASMTKSLTALTIAKLMQMDSIDIYKSVYHYLPNLPKKKYDFSIKDVGGHLAGIKRIPTGERYDCENTFNTTDKLYKSFGLDDLALKPRTAMKYSNYGYKLLGLIIEKKCGNTLTNCHKSLILDKLNLNSIVPDSKNSLERNSSFYVEKNGKNILAPCLDCTLKYAQGCYLSTSEDFIKLMHGILYSKELLSKESLKELLIPQKTIDGKYTGYGFGFMSKNDTNKNFFFGHNGGYPGSRTVYRVYPKQKLVITVFTNKSGYFKLTNLITDIANDCIKSLND